MKKLFVFFLVLFVSISNCIPSYAYTNTDIDTMYVIEELEECESVILDSANRILESQQKSQIGSDDIDYSKAIKIFVDVNILDNDNLNSEMLQNYIKTAEYVYYLPVYVDGNSIYLTISRGKEVTERAISLLEEEDVERLESLVGKWYVPEIQIYPYIVDFKNNVDNAIEENKIDNAQVYYFGGISGNMPLVAAICSNDSTVQFDIVKQIENSSDIVLGDDENQPKKENLISYERIKEIALENGDLKDGQAGSVGQNYSQGGHRDIILIISWISVILLLSIMSILFVNKSQRRNAYEQEK